MSNSVGQIDLDLRVNEAGFHQQMNGIAGNATGMVGGAFKKLGLLVAGAFAVTALTRFGNSAIKLASDLSEVQNVVDVTFGNMSNQINVFSKSAIESFGLSEYSAKKFSSTMGAMLKSSGLTGQGMTDMSIGVTKLAGDMASFYNLSGEEAFTKIRAGLSGETEPLKQLGVNMSVANLEAYAMSQGITKSYQKMDQASQSLLRYNYLLSVTKDAQGDFARTSGSWANQVKILSERWNTFKATMGQGFINMLTPVLTGLNWLIAKLQIAAAYFSAFTQMIFGNAGPAKTASVNIENIGDAAGAAATGAAGAASAQDKLGDSVKKTAAAIKGSLGSFDQLNVLSKDTADASGDTGGAGGGGGGGIGGGGGGIEVPPVVVPVIDTSGLITVLEPLKKILDELLAPLKALDFGPLVAAFERLKLAVAPMTSALFEGLRWAYFNLFVPLAAWTIQEALPAFLDVLSGCFKVLSPLLDAFKPVGLWLFEHFLAPLARWTGGVIVDVLIAIADALTTVGAWIGNNQEAVRVMGGVVAVFFGAWVIGGIVAFIEISGGLAMAFGTMIGKIWLAVGAEAAHQISLGLGVIAQIAYNIIMGIGTVVMTLAAAAVWLFNGAMAVLTSPITLVIAAIVLLIAGVYLLIKHWDDVKIKAAACWESVKSAWTAAGTWFKTNVTTPIGGFFKTMFDGVKNAPAAVITGVKNAFKTLGSWFSTYVTKPIAGFFTGMFNGIKNAPAAVVRGIKSAFTSVANWFKTTIISPIASGFKGLWNGVIGGMNAVISGINKIKFSFPSWVPVIGGKSFGINLPHIPKLANGGLVSAPTLALVGDNKHASTDPEVVAPLSKLKAMLGNTGGNAEMIALLQKVLEAIKSQNGDIILKVGESEFGRIAIKTINNAQRQAGVTLLEV